MSTVLLCNANNFTPCMSKIAVHLKNIEASGVTSLNIASWLRTMADCAFDYSYTLYVCGYY